MALSRRDVARLVQEIAPALAGGAIGTAFRDGDDVFILPVRQGERRLALELALDPDAARVAALPGEALDAPDKAAKKARRDDPHAFLAWLRKCAGGRRVEAIVQLGGDRVITVDLARDPTAVPEEGGAPPQGPDRVRLVVELLGRAPNLVLLDRVTAQGVVLATLVPGRAQRPLAPGSAYVAPPPAPPPREGEAPRVEEVLAPEVEPDPGTLALSRAVARLQRERAEQGAASAWREALIRAATQGEKRARGLIAKLEGERDEAQKAEALRQRGELLKANAATIPRGAAKAVVTDFFAPEPREIELELDPTESVLDQARALFKRAKKLDRGLVAVETRLGEADGKAEALARLVARATAAAPDDAAALDAIERELEKLGCAPEKPKEPEAERPKKKEEATGPRKFVSRDRLQILVGRSNVENDRLTMTIARGNDLFFHVRGFPGSHVIVRQDSGKSVPLDTLLDAAALAVHYSKVRGNLRAEVTYTPRKFVRKPRRAKPGLVEVANEKTIRPDGDPARLKRLLATAGRTPDELRDGQTPPPRADDDDPWDDSEDGDA